MPEHKKRGGPRKPVTIPGADRIKNYRKRKLSDGRRYDIYLPTKASWRLSKLSQAWGCSPSVAVERLVMEAEGRYHDILFHEVEKDTV
jgi:hypothetical protein